MPSAFLLVWNPARWGWMELERDIETVQQGRSPADFNWSCGKRRNLPVGSLVYLMRLGDIAESEKGLIARGITTSSPAEGRHWAARQRDDSALYVSIELDSLEKTPVIPLRALQRIDPNYRWTPQASGVAIPSALASKLSAAWPVQSIRTVAMPEEIASSTVFPEGAVRLVQVNRFERSAAARAACIHIHGTSCAACGMNFRGSYGSIADGFIHIHHLKSLASLGPDYRVQPETDLVPLCANCHAVAHLQEPPFTIEQLRDFLRDCS